MIRTSHPVCIAMLCLFVTACDKTVETSSDTLEPDSSMVEPDTSEPPSIVAKPPSLSKLTQTQYRNTIRDLFGEDVVVPGGLEPDTASDGLYAVGASVSSVSPLGAERYADAARSIAGQIVENLDVLALLPTVQPSRLT